MSYATPDDVRSLGLPPDALEELTDPDIQDQLDADAGVIDVFLAPNSVLPIVAPYPNFLRRVNVCLAVYHILLRRGFNPEGPDDHYKTQFDECMKMLEKVSKGQLTIPGLVDSTPSVSDGAPLFSTSPLRGW